MDEKIKQQHQPGDVFSPSGVASGPTGATKPAKKPKLPKKVLRVLVVAAVIIGVALSGVVFASWLNNYIKTKDAVNVANKFVDNLSNDPATSYNLTTGDFHTKFSEEQLKLAVADEKTKQLLQTGTSIKNRRKLNNDHVEVTYGVRSNEGSVQYQIIVHVLKDQGQWKVEGVNTGSQDLAPLQSQPNVDSANHN